ncbi:agmatine deiminase [Psychromonas sp. MB-3u-54]|uniref:agmatine deiminase n=1 Tax=Psychromonas sp. MB-3u-54 TaxID=2058319 RepID=UPI000C336089|nr:agmatine deiminase [Psychromonas sp. MB-3u-54]PKH01395.1 agmatine deiminase [Psychromonas sp. MB-3u-54]
MELTTTPQNDGFYFPAEFSPQQAVWLAWPERADNWRLNGKPAQKAFAAIANAIAEVVPVSIIVSQQQYQPAKMLLNASIQLIEMDYNDAWMRDIGPTVLINSSGQHRAVSWQFNSWGGDFNGLYSPWNKDDQVAKNVSELLHLDFYQAPFVLEGGAIHTDGEGTLYTTEECLLSPGRNPHLTKSGIETLLAQYLGIKKIIWIPQGLYNDETDGHVDNLIHVVGPAKVVLSWTDDRTDPQYAISLQALALLNSSCDAQGRQIEVTKLPIPGPLYMTAQEAAEIEPSKGMVRKGNERLAGSYTNFLMLNQTVFVPALDEKQDKIVSAILSDLLPEYRIVLLPAREVLLGGGNIHCITQQIPH